MTYRIKLRTKVIVKIVHQERKAPAKGEVRKTLKT